MTDTSLNNSRTTSSRSSVRGRGRGEQSTSDAPSTSASSRLDVLRKPSVLIVFFVIALILPNYFFLGPLRLSVYRTILLLMAIPLVVQWLSGRAGGFKLIDFLLIGHGVWIMLSLFVHHGMGNFQISGVLAMETVIPFLLARIYVRTPEDFAYFIKAVCWGITFMLPLAIIEALTGRIVISEILGLLSPVYPDNQDEVRLGMQRAQGPFEHPILFGVFCATMFSAALLVWGHELKGFSRTMRTMSVGLATFFSLSMGAYISLMIQAGLMIWNQVLKKVPNRWLILIVGFLAVYIAIDLASNRSPINVITSTLTFRGAAAYNRLLIWEYGTAVVERSPIFGIGFNDWKRQPWMPASVDNFWLVIPMKFGLPALFFVMVPFIMTLLKTTKRDFSGDPRMTNYRMAYIFGLVGFSLSISTVYVWNATYVFLIFFLGSGVWMWDYKETKAQSETDGDSGGLDDPDGSPDPDLDPDPDKPKYQSARTRLPRHASAGQSTRKRGPTRSSTRNTTRSPKRTRS